MADQSRDASGSRLHLVADCDALTGVGVVFSCSHRDPVRKELHGHSYEAVAWWPAHPPKDAALLQRMLWEVVKASLDHKTLPDDITRGEDIRELLLEILPTEVVDVDINRPMERIYVRGVR